MRLISVRNADKVYSLIVVQIPKVGWEVISRNNDKQTAREKKKGTRYMAYYSVSWNS